MKVSEIKISKAKANISFISAGENGKYTGTFIDGHITFFENLIAAAVTPSTKNWMKLTIGIEARSGNGKYCRGYLSGTVFGENFSADEQIYLGKNYNSYYDEQIEKTFPEIRANPNITLNFIKSNGEGTLPRDSSDFNAYVWANISIHPERYITGVISHIGSNVRSNIVVKFDGNIAYEKGFYYVVKVYKKGGKELLYESDLIDDRKYMHTIKRGTLPVNTEMYAVMEFYYLIHCNGAWFSKNYNEFEDGKEDIFSTAIQEEETFTLIDTAPKILSLEPDNVEVNKDKTVVVSWTSKYQETYELSVNDTVYSGTTEKSVTLPPKTLKSGSNSITLKIKNVVDGVEDVDSKTVTFTAYGKPSIPIINAKTIYGTANPTFYWDSEEQVAYHVKVTNNENVIVDTGEVAGTNKLYTLTTPLANNTSYDIQVAIKNQKGLWSDFAKKTIQISFSTLPVPNIVLLTDNQGNIIVNVTNDSNTDFSYAEIWRKTEFTDWIRMAINLPLISSFCDSTVASKMIYHYKAMVYTQEGGVTESEIKSIEVDIPYDFFVDVENMQTITMGYTLNENSAVKFKRIIDKQIIHYDGKEAPDMERGVADYTVASFSVAFKDYSEFKNFEYFAEKAKLLLFRDRTGHKIYGHITAWGDEEELAVGYIKISFTFTESHFIETDIYDGGRKSKLIRLDEGWKLDSGLLVDMMIYSE